MRRALWSVGLLFFAAAPMACGGEIADEGESDALGVLARPSDIGRPTRGRCSIWEEEAISFGRRSRIGPATVKINRCRSS